MLALFRINSLHYGWKQANVTAVYKNKGSKTEPGNNRPISVLPVLARVLERAIASQLHRYCDTKEIIPPQQFGFRRNSSCEVALLAALDSWIGSVDTGKFVGALLIDLSKAFDSVSHPLLLENLKKLAVVQKPYSGS
jgi:hypothetical protein